MELKQQLDNQFNKKDIPVVIENQMKTNEELINDALKG